MSNSQADASDTGWFTPEKAIFLACAAVALPVVYVLTERLGTVTYPALFVTLAVVFLPPFVYWSYWPKRYDPPRATGWGLLAGILVAVQLVAVILLAESTLGPDGSVIAAFAAVVAVDYAVVRVLLG